MKETEAAIKAAKKAGELIMKNFNKVHTVEVKSQQEIVTETDKEAERIILERLMKEFPDHSVLSEESGSSEGSSEFMWVVDPLDGTTNYSIKNPFFDVSIALAGKSPEGWKVVSGVVYAPFTKEMFFAEKGSGAFLNDKQIVVSKETDIKNLLLVYCSGYSQFQIQRAINVFSELKPLGRDLTRMRAGALELAYVAAGRLGAFISPGGKPWDAAAGQLLVTEAGGVVTGFGGEPWSVEGEERDIIASNGKVHDRILEIVKGK